jgi:hypothetical protein
MPVLLCGLICGLIENCRALNEWLGKHDRAATRATLNSTDRAKCELSGITATIGGSAPPFHISSKSNASGPEKTFATATELKEQQR